MAVYSLRILGRHSTFLPYIKFYCPVVIPLHEVLTVIQWENVNCPDIKPDLKKSWCNHSKDLIKERKN